MADLLIFFPSFAKFSNVLYGWKETRPWLVEIQAFVDHSALENPRRVAVEADQNRLSMLLAILHRHDALQIKVQEVFANVVVSVKVEKSA